MSKFEDVKKSYLENDPDLGSYEVEVSKTEDGEKAKIVRNPDVDEKDFIKDKKDYNESEKRETVIEDLDVEWEKELKMEEVFDRDEMEQIFMLPDDFIATLNAYKEKLKPGNYSVYLEEIELDIKQKMSILEDKRDVAVNQRADYKETPDDTLNYELRFSLEKKIKEVDMYIKNGKKALDFIEERRTELLTG